MGKLETLLLAGRLFSGGAAGDSGATLLAPALSLTEDTLTITPGDNGGFCTGYLLRSGGETVATVEGTTVDLSALSLTAGQTYNLTARAAGTGMSDSTDSNAVSWVNKPKPTVTLSAETLDVIAGHTATLTVTTPSDGTISAESSNPAAATVSVSGNTVTVTGVGIGSAVISVSVAEGSEHRPVSNVTAQAEVTAAYLRLSAPGAFTLEATQNWDGTLYASTDKSTWTVWTGSSLSAGSEGEGYALYLRGSGNTGMTATESPNPWVISGSQVELAGMLEALLDYAAVENGQAPTMGVKAFYFWLKSCNAVRSAARLKLHRTSLTEGCYQGMFSTCTALVNPPAFPMTTLVKNCYQACFVNCSALVTAPALPATTLADGCYRAMFSGCSSLQNPPELNAATVEQNGYYSMFANCTSLTVAPPIRAASIAQYGCRQMFEGCVGLTVPPALPAATIAKEAYSSMFRYCTRLHTVPELPATVMSQNCYMSMFSGCSAIRIMGESGGIFTHPWRIPKSGTADTGNASSWNASTLVGTSGSIVGNPSADTTYYTDHAPVSCEVTA